MQMEPALEYSLHSLNRSISMHSIYNDKPLKVLLKIIFNKYKKNNSRENSQCIRLSELKGNSDGLNDHGEYLKVENNSNNKSQELIEPDVININLDKIVKEMEKTMNKKEVKAIKIIIIVSEDKIEDCYKNKDSIIENEDSNNETNNKISSNEQKMTNREVSVVEKCDDDDDNNRVSLFLSTPGMVKLLNEETSNEPETFYQPEYDFIANYNELNNFYYQEQMEQKEVLINEKWSRKENENITEALIASRETQNEKNISTEEQKLEYRNEETISIQTFISPIELATSNKNKSVIENKYTLKSTQIPQESVTDVSDVEKNRDSLIIHDIVMERYNEVLNNHIQRSLKRKLSRKSNLVLDDEEKLTLETKPTRSIESYLNKFDCTSNQTLSQSKGKSLDSGLHDITPDFFKTKSVDTIQSGGEEKVEYDAYTFLREALGDDMLNTTNESQETLEVSFPAPIKKHTARIYATERSIGSSEISTLISHMDSKSDGVNSLYSTVNKVVKKRPAVLKKTSVVKPMFSSLSFNNDYDYESIDKFIINPRTEVLLKEISTQHEIIQQVSKALNFCRNKTEYLWSTAHLEAEKVLLYASHKEEVLNNELNKTEYEYVEEGENFGTIKILNLKFQLKPQTPDRIDESDQYFVCLVHSGVRVLASDIVLPDETGDIMFKNCFEFSDLISDFEINISLYSMTVKKINQHNKKNIFFSPRKLCSTWRNEEAKMNNTPSKKSLFQLLGKSKLGSVKLFRHDKFKMEKILHSCIVSETFTADVQNSIKMNNRMTGFLTIGTSNVLWNRRWCVLEGFRLKYWNYPSDENVMEPIGEFNLLHCITYRVTSADRNICARPRTFILEIKHEERNSSPKQYFLSADNKTDLDEWKRQLNSVLISLHNWNSLNCQNIQ